MRYFLVLFLLLPVSLFSQQGIGKTRAELKTFLQTKTGKQQGFTATLTNSDTALVYTMVNTDGTNASRIYRFTKKGICQSEQLVASCDSCLRHYLDQVLHQSEFGWKKINENQYISNFNSYRVIEIPGNKADYSFFILRTDWDEAMYKLLTGEK